MTQYGPDELRAAVEAATNWGTYVTVHAYTVRAVQQALEAGVKCIDHGHLLDLRRPLPRSPSTALHSTEIAGYGRIADGPDEVRRAVREQLMMGASQVKLAAGGGVASNFDPLDVAQYGESEFRAAVESAENWGTYITVHAYTPLAIQTALKAGVKVIDHGQLMDDATAKLMAEKGAWRSLQPFLDDQEVPFFPEGSASRAK